MLKDILEWCLANTGFIGVIIAIITLSFAYSGIKQWKVDKMIDMHYKFKEERTNILDKIAKLDNTKDSYQEDVDYLYTDLLNELELISLLHQEGYLEDHISKQMFNTWIEAIYESEDIKKVICQAKINDLQAYENLEKTYRQWNNKEVKK